MNNKIHWAYSYEDWLQNNDKSKYINIKTASENTSYICVSCKKLMKFVKSYMRTNGTKVNGYFKHNEHTCILSTSSDEKKLPKIYSVLNLKYLIENNILKLVNTCSYTDDTKNKCYRNRSEIIKLNNNYVRTDKHIYYEGIKFSIDLGIYNNYNKMIYGFVFTPRDKYPDKVYYLNPQVIDKEYYKNNLQNNKLIIFNLCKDWKCNPCRIKIRNYKKKEEEWNRAYRLFSKALKLKSIDFKLKYSCGHYIKKNDYSINYDEFKNVNLSEIKKHNLEYIILEIEHNNLIERFTINTKTIIRYKDNLKFERSINHKCEECEQEDDYSSNIIFDDFDEEDNDTCGDLSGLQARPIISTDEQNINKKREEKIKLFKKSFMENLELF